ncbi:RsiV family protein [Mycobacterium sp. CPCC 205372]|uniref:RsiV family protein n=1 Tax=Mycobacterium hippophais TaxID=3016340 RepID=A0ABT4Q0L3_9MYCO|nr:RsiV family protein [Mycobacterium hippophais]MCZ8382239.1 RsiV family protein [Mycobacterium hippophais]
MTAYTASSTAAVLSAVVILMSPTAGAQTHCADLGGAVDPAGTCRIHGSAPGYRLDITYPTTYPDEAALAAAIEQERDEFVEWAEDVEGPIQKELDIVPHVHRSGRTESVVLTIGTNTGVRPVTTFRSFTYDTDRHTPITIDTLFKPGAQPLSVLNPIVQRELIARGSGLPDRALPLHDYRTFALTDDTVTFFFPQGVLLPHVDGPLTVDIPRSQISSHLA